MTDRLFVYGTLAPGETNEHVLASLQGTWIKATIRGRLFPEGWGATLGYPALVLDEAGELIEGWLFSSPELEQHWGRVDEFEGDGYRRTLASVGMEEGEYIDAFVYVLREDC